MRGAEFDCVLPDFLLQAENLPTLPPAAIELLRLARDEGAGLDDYARALASEPFLAERLLALANSCTFTLGPKVTSLQRATLVLGTKRVQHMALAFSLADVLPSQGANPGFDYAGFWKRSLTTAVAARELAQVLGAHLEEEAFLCALASHMGQLVLAECLPAEYAEVLARSDGWPCSATEEVVLGFDGAEIGGALLRAWGLPALHYLSVVHAADPGGLPADASASTRALCRILELALLVGRVLCDADGSAALGELHARATKAGLGRLPIEELILALEPRLAETGELLAIDLGPPRPHAEILEDARRKGAAGDAPSLDA